MTGVNGVAPAVYWIRTKDRHATETRAIAAANTVTMRCAVAGESRVFTRSKYQRRGGGQSPLGRAHAVL